MTLKAGDRAPAFESTDQDGKKVKLSDFRGKKLILYFYPKDDTSGCTKEACNFRDNYAGLRKKGYQVVGVSADSEQSHQKFTNKFDLPFTLLADIGKKILSDYGVWGEKSMYGRKYMGIFRTTFVIDEKGIIERVITKVDTANSTEQILSQ